jgi:small-conductance mechanosensitive channel
MAEVGMVASVSGRIRDVQSWLGQLTEAAALTEWGALFACVLLAWLLVWLLRRALRADLDLPVLFGRQLVDGALFPLLLLSLAYATHAAFRAMELQLAVFRVALPVLVSLAVIRVGVKVLQVAFKDAPLVRTLERTISWLVWAAMVLWVTGLLPAMLEELDRISWTVGSAKLSVRTLLEGTLTAGAVLIVSLWISSAIEGQLLKSATGGDLSLRKAVSNAVRALLVGVGLLLGLSAVGIDLTALSVLGGAIGVGVGLGLQKLAASYVSGFVMLAERSVRIGDSVRIDNFEGRITDIKARYTIVRALSGRESVVPNEMFIGNRIENLSLTDPKVLQQCMVSVGYDSDVELVMRLLMQAASAQPRVLADPAPAVHLSNFGTDGLEFTLNYWILDPENGQSNLRSAVNLVVLQSFREHGIEIPFPQRVVHQSPKAVTAPVTAAS